MEFQVKFSENKWLRDNAADIFGAARFYILFSKCAEITVTWRKLLCFLPWKMAP
jgi:hypothetical protein